MDIQERVAFASLTTFAVGGSVRFLITAHSPEDIRNAYAFAKEKGLPALIIGGGSNILGDDGDIEAVFIRPSIQGRTFTDTDCVVGSGEVWDAVVQDASERGLWGIENLSGIPGTAGGAAVQNIGAYGCALSEVVSFVEVLDLATGAVRRLSNAECLFGYRTSIFKQKQNSFVILHIGFSLHKEGVPNISYRDLAVYFEGRKPALQEIRNAVLEIRSRKFPDTCIEGTAGSFFKNPILTEAQAKAIAEKYPDMPLFSMPETTGVKLPLAWILDKILHLRGAEEGLVRAYEEQPLVIVAKRGASARDVRAFAQSISERLQKISDISIEPEVCILRNATYTNTLS